MHLPASVDLNEGTGNVPESMRERRLYVNISKIQAELSRRIVLGIDW
jgi:hypothetical protein